MHARYYSSWESRFLSVDPAQADPKNPQSWNRYGYVLNNPLILIDPDGLQWVWYCSEDYGCGWTSTGEITVDAADPGRTGPNNLADDPMLTDEVNAFFAGLEIYKGTPPTGGSLMGSTMARVGGTLTPSEQSQVQPFLDAYSSWLNDPTLGLGQQDGAKYFGPIGNARYFLTGGQCGSSCTAWATGVVNSLSVLNTSQTRMAVKQVWVPVPHTYAAVQIRTVSGGWMDVQYLDPFWMLR